MARAKSWTESQQPENQYTYSQYVFNVIGIGLVAVALAVFLFWLLQTPPVPVTHVVTVRSNVGELRIIPFQKNDLDQLNAAFAADAIRNCEPFNDQQSFENLVHANVNTLEPKDIDSLIVVCSAIGEVRDSKPILRPTDGSGEISIETFLKQCVVSSAARNRIVILDCGHDFSTPERYQDEKFVASDDFNSFVDHVESLVRQLESPDRPIWVITSTGVGEVPLYSVNQRRTLFSLALEKALNANHDNPGDFFDSIVDFCRKHGGEAAQTPRLFESGVGAVAASDVKSDHRISKLAQRIADEDQPASEEEAAPNQDPITTAELARITELADARQKVLADYQSQNLLAPFEFDTSAWDAAMIEIAEQSVNLRNANAPIVKSALVEKFFQSNHIRAAREVNGQYPGFTVSEPPVVLTDAEQDAHDIAQAFSVFQTAKFRAKYYAAIFDSLSWIDASQPLELYRQTLTELDQLILQHAQLFQAPHAKLEQVELYRRVKNELAALDQDVDRNLTNLCRRLEDLHGMTREVAIVGILDSPLIHSGPADGNSKSDRQHLLKLLASDRLSGSGELMTLEKRRANSLARKNLYGRLLQFGSLEKSLQNRRLDAMAFYVNVGDSPLPDPIEFEKPKIVYTAEAGNKYVSGLVIEPYSNDPKKPGGTSVDIDLITKPENGRVDLTCKLDPDAPYRVFDPTDPVNSIGKQITIKNSDGKIGIVAEANVASQEHAQKSYALTVEIQPTYQGHEFANPQRPFLIPLMLPSQNRVELIVKMDQRESNVAPQGNFSLRPWPNRATPLEFLVANAWHKPRTLEATIYPCASIADHPILPGDIDQAIRDKTLLGLKNGVLPAIAKSNPIEIGAGVDSQLSDPKKITWAHAAPPAADQPVAKSLPAGEPFPQGLLCRVQDPSAENPKTWDFWLPVFPETRDYVTVRPQVDNDALLLSFSKSPEFTDRNVKVRWHLSDSGESYPLDLSGTEAVNNFSAIKDLNRVIAGGNSRPFLYVDVDNWPRRYVFVYDGLTFERIVNQSERFPNAQFSGARLTSEVPEGEPSVFLTAKTWPDKQVEKLLAYRPTGARPGTIYGNLEINCLINATQFSFPGSRDFFEIKYGGNPKKYYFPRKITSTLAPDPETGVWKINCDVADFPEELDVTSNTYDIDPTRFVFRESPQPLRGRDVTRFIFDSVPPFRPQLTIRTPEVEPGRAVGFDVSPIQDNRGGIGTNGIASVEYVLNEMPPKTPGKWNQYDCLAFLAPKEEGVYDLSVYVVDWLGNRSEAAKGKFEVKIKAVPVVPEKKPEKPAPPLTHVLLVNVSIASSPLKKDQDPELEIEPADGKPERINDTTFKFSGLKPGVKYTVTGKYKMTSGFKIETEGKIDHEFSKDAKTQVTKTKNLTLEGK